MISWAREVFRKRQWQQQVDITHDTNANDVHCQVLRPDEKLGLWITEHVGTMGFFALLATWIVIWVAWNLRPLPHFDPGPAFVVLLLGSNFIQLLLMPLIMVGQNVQSRHQEIQAEVDHKTLGYLRQVNELQLQILEQLRTSEANAAGQQRSEAERSSTRDVRRTPRYGQRQDRGRQRLAQNRGNP